MRVLFSILLLFVSTVVAHANDSAAEIALGGLTLVPSGSISLDAEDLYISKEEVRVEYRFTNTADKDVETLVAFPLPDQVPDDSGDVVFADMRGDLNFRTLVDGKPVTYDVVEQALVGGKDVTKRVTEIGLSLNSTADWEGFQAKMKAMAEADRKALLGEGVVSSYGNETEAVYQPMWTLRTSVTRQQVFPAGKTVSVQHRYRPLAGGSVGGNLNPEHRNADWSKEYGARSCIDDDFYRAFDKALKARKSEDNPSPYSEVWLGYVLKSGANWKGPIKDFRLVVDKGKPENLVSFCAEGVKKIAPTQFEVRKTDFEPKDDLLVMIVEWYGEEE
ncbi:MAG: DUF4424 domain-containing protein [Phyllobacteriaceae bacterium]|nr:DUF4424 domain-containing protein [Phyllobacteriaceae bacterium]